VTVTKGFERGVHDRSGWLQGCRCSVCHSALLEDARLRRALAAVTAGRRLAARVPPHRARRRVAQLRREGWSVQRIADAAGLSSTTVDRIANRRLAHVSHLTEAAVLGIG
jgi:DNA-directed RNA polymerase specialized sigma24 family protein